jgi:hypothetical protein
VSFLEVPAENVVQQVPAVAGLQMAAAATDPGAATFAVIKSEPVLAAAAWAAGMSASQLMAVYAERQ